MENKILKTSEEWYMQERKEKRYKILDYDSWVKIGSWEEKITYEKYAKSLLESTIGFNYDWSEQE